MKQVSGFLLGLVVLAVSAGAQEARAKLEWFDDYGEALREARTTGKPLLLAFRCVP